MDYRCTHCRTILQPGSNQCKSCGLQFEQAVPGAIASAQIGSGSPDTQGQNPFDQPLFTPQAPKRFGAKRRIIGSAIAVGVIVIMVIVYNCWDSWFPARSSSSGNKTSMAQIQPIAAQNIPASGSPNTSAPAATPPASFPPSELSPPALTPEQRADAEIRAAQARGAEYEAQQQAQAQNVQQDAVVPGGQRDQAPSTEQADEEMAALYAAGENSYQKFLAGGYENPSVDPSSSGTTDSFGLSGMDALDDIRKRMCRLAPYVTPSRNDEFLEDYWRLNLREKQEDMKIQYGQSAPMDFEPPMPGGYTWGSER